MAATVHPFPERGFVAIRATGALLPEDVLGAHEEVLARWPGLNRLWDFRAADLTGWSAADLRASARAIAEREPPGVRLRVAGLAQRDVDYGISRMFASLAPPGGPVEYLAFRDEKEAESWLEAGAREADAPDR